MSIIRHALLVVCAAFLSLLIVAIAVSVVAVASDLGRPAPAVERLSAAFIFFLYTLVCGFLPTALVIVPAYVVLQRRAMLHWAVVFALGVAPGVVALTLDRWVGVIGIICGSAVAALTVWFSGKLGIES